MSLNEGKQQMSSASLGNKSISASWPLAAKIFFILSPQNLKPVIFIQQVWRKINPLLINFLSLLPWIRVQNSARHPYTKTSRWISQSRLAFLGKCSLLSRGTPNTKYESLYRHITLFVLEWLKKQQMKTMTLMKRMEEQSTVCVMIPKNTHFQELNM